MPFEFHKPKLKYWLKFGSKTPSKVSSKSGCQLHLIKQYPAEEKSSLIYAIQVALGGPNKATQDAISAPCSAMYSPRKGGRHDAITSTSSWKWVMTAGEIKAGLKGEENVRADAGVGAASEDFYALGL